MSISVNHREFYIRPPAGSTFRLHAVPTGGIALSWEFQDALKKTSHHAFIFGRFLTQNMPKGDEVRVSIGYPPVYSPMDLVLHFEKGKERSILEWLRAWAFGLSQNWEIDNPAAEPLPGIEPARDTAREAIEAMTDIIEMNVLSQVEYWESQDPPFQGETVTTPSTPEAKQAAYAALTSKE